MHCHLIVPDLFWPERSDRSAYGSVTPIALQLLLARGRKSVLEFADAGLDSFESWLLQRCGIARDEQGDWPVAAFTALADGLRSPGEPSPAYWLRADPAHLRVDRDRLLASELDASSLRLDEARALVATLNTHFESDGLHFEAPNAERWYVRTATPARLITTPLAAAHGRSVEALMPTGPDTSRWRAVMNEAQMLLHEHAVNQAREERGELPINSIWLWGGGEAAPVTAKSVRWLAEDALARGLARAADTPALPLASGAGEWLRSAPQAGIAWIVLDQLRQPARRLEADRWQATLARLERDWFAPMIGALRDGRLGMVSLHAIGESSALSAEATAQDLRRFWRRPKSLVEYISLTGAP